MRLLLSCTTLTYLLHKAYLLSSWAHKENDYEYVKVNAERTVSAGQPHGGICYVRTCTYVRGRTKLHHGLVTIIILQEPVMQLINVTFAKRGCKIVTRGLH